MIFKRYKVFRNALITTAKASFYGDIALENGFISEIGPSLSGSFDEEINLDGLRVLPGCIDPHVHFELSVNDLTTRDNFVDGSRYALKGGVTTVIDFSDICPEKPLYEMVLKRYQKAKKAECSVFLHAAVSGWLFSDEKHADICMRLGVRSFKFFTTYKESGRMSSYEAIEHAAMWAARNDACIIVHAEDSSILRPISEFESDSFRFYESSRPVEAEVAAISKLAAIQKRTGALMAILHVSSGSGVEAARNSGLKLETCPHYLSLTRDVYQNSDGYKFAVAPPLRSMNEQNRLWEAVVNGEINWIGSDHAPFSPAVRKKTGDHFTKAPFGLAGVGNLLPTMIDEGINKGRISWEQLVALTSENAAKFYGLYPQKGCIAEGSDADLIAVDDNNGIDILSLKKTTLGP
jgi:dihydropyrimidinase